MKVHGNIPLTKHPAAGVVDGAASSRLLAMPLVVRIKSEQ